MSSSGEEPSRHGRLAWRSPDGVRALFLLIVVGGIVAAHAWRLWYSRMRWLDVDELEHLHAAWCVARGMVPYRDFFEHHPPLLYLAIAPFFRFADVDASARDAVAFVLAGRLAMWTMGAGALALTYAIGARWRDARTGLVAAFLLSLTIAFSQKVVEIRPDVPALVLWLLALWLLLPLDSGNELSPRRAALAGMALGLALTFTQKVVFGIAGLGGALLWSAARAAAPHPRRRRLTAVLAAAGGGVLVLLPLVVSFAREGALGALYHYNVTYNVQLGRLVSPWRFSVEILTANPLLTILGMAGIARSLWAARRDAGASGDMLLGASGATLVLGAIAGPSSYLQYFLPLLPILALLGGAALIDLTGRLLREPRDPERLHGALAAMLVAASVWPVVQMRELSRTHWSNAHGLRQIAWVVEHTAPSDSVLAGWRTLPGVFRPHAFFYFFLSSRQAIDAVPPASRAELRARLVSGALAPAVVVPDEFLRALVPELDSVLAARYEPVLDSVLYRRRWRGEQPDDSIWARADSLATLSGVPVVLRASAWRDFMPAIGRDGGSDLMVNLVIESTEGAALPAALVDSAWVRSSEGMWATAPSPESRPESGTGRDLMLRGGPPWPPGTPLDVLVRVRLSSGGVVYLRDRRAGIGRVS